jgi:hypothetical protein
LASAGAWPPRQEATTTALAPNARIIRIITPSLLLQAIARLPCHSRFAVSQISPAFTEVAETLFSVIV